MREMKDSGIEWIGEIPKDWEVGKIKRYYNLQTGFTPDTRNRLYYADNDEGFDWFTIGDLNGKRIIPTRTKSRITQKYIDEYCPNIIPKNSLLYSFKLSVGQVAFTDRDIYSNEAIASFLPKNNINLGFLYYSSCFIKENSNENIYGAKLLNQELIKNAFVIFPPLSEQQRIASYLDSKCSKIDDIIEKQQSVIEKLKAYKQSIITEAVTKGLNPDVPMKDSGVEWIGEVPEHWSVIKLKYATQIMRGRFNHRPRNDPRYYDGKYPFIQTGDVARAKKYISSYSQTLNELGYDVSKEFPKGSICMTIAANVGDVAILDFNACFPDSVVGFFPQKNIYLEYLYFVLRSMKQQFLRNAIISTQLNLNIEIIKEEFIPVTKIDEQKQIADYLDQKCSAIDSTIANTQALIEKLTAYKKSLIYEVVTGKKEV